MSVALRNVGSADAYGGCTLGTRAGRVADAFSGGRADRATAGASTVVICARVLQFEDLGRPISLRWFAEAGLSADVVSRTLSGALSATADAQGY